LASEEFAVWLHLILAIFWLVAGIIVQIFWTTLSQLMNFPVSRELMGFIFFVLFSYNFIRWRLARIRQPVDDDTSAAPKPKVIDPTFDFSKPDPRDDEKNDSSHV
jgi:hypothetical protein